MKNKTFYWILALAVIVIIVVAVIIIRNSTNKDTTNNETNNVLNNNTQPVNNSNSNSSPAPVNTNTDAYIHGKSVKANNTSGTGLTTIYKKEFDPNTGLKIYTTVPKGTYIGVADKFDSNKNYISVFIPEAWTYMLVQVSQVKIG